MFSYIITGIREHNISHEWYWSGCALNVKYNTLLQQKKKGRDEEKRHGKKKNFRKMLRKQYEQYNFQKITWATNTSMTHGVLKIFRNNELN
jgi:predicted DsbA family dithiol-disulfide isomerase